MDRRYIQICGMLQIKPKIITACKRLPYKKNTSVKEIIKNVLRVEVVSTYAETSFQLSVVFTSANHERDRQSGEPIKTWITSGWRKARENECERITIGYASISDWLRKWREFFQPIMKQKCKRKLLWTLQVKTALIVEAKAMSFVTHVLNCHLSIFSRYSSRQAAIIYNIFHIRTNHVAGKKPTTIVKTIS